MNGLERKGRRSDDRRNKAAVSTRRIRIRSLLYGISNSVLRRLISAQNVAKSG